MTGLELLIALQLMTLGELNGAVVTDLGLGVDKCRFVMEYGVIELELEFDRVAACDDPGCGD